MVVQDMELLESPLRLNLWRAPLANELDNWNASSARSSNWKEGYGYTVATEMYSAGTVSYTHLPRRENPKLDPRLWHGGYHQYPPRKRMD